MVTMSDIARQAGVSRATVSYVLNKRHNGVRIPDDTRRQILELAAEMGYRPNELARAVVTGVNRVLGFVTGNLGYEPTARLLSGAVEEAGRHNYFIKVFHVRGEKLDNEVIENSIKLRLAGLVVCALHEYVDKLSLRDEVREELERNGVSLAVVGSNMFIYSDDRQGFRLSIDHLHSLGHERIGFLSGAPTAAICVSRETDWKWAMNETGLEVGPHSIDYGGWEPKETREALQRWMANPETRPTALCCVTDRAALIALRVARQIGLSVPEDISIVGFGGLSTTELSDPPLTTVSQPFEVMGAAAVRHLLLLAQNADKDAADMPPELLPLELAVRESTAPPTVSLTKP